MCRVTFVSYLTMSNGQFVWTLRRTDSTLGQSQLLPACVAKEFLGPSCRNYQRRGETLQSAGNQGPCRPPEANLGVVVAGLGVAMGGLGVAVARLGVGMEGLGVVMGRLGIAMAVIAGL